MIASEEFRSLVGRFATGLTVVTTHDNGELFGTTASAMTSVSLDPPTLLVCMNKTSVTGQAIARSGHFVVNILSDEQAHVATHFAQKGSAFDGQAVRTGHRGAPILVDALAVFECRVTDEVTAGTHSIVIGEVEYGHGGDGNPLAYYQGRLGRLAFDDSLR
jgi:4-nitrophenol 2-monooxygenase / 4-nitrocatechol 4-monooxygenase, reductase component